jgi:acetate kinase
MRVLVLNAGSSSLKASVVEDDATVARAEVSFGADATTSPGQQGAVRDVLASLGGAGVGAQTIEAVGHRVVHGGATFSQPTLLDERAMAALDELNELAPLHNAVAVGTVRAAQGALPGIPQIACFDTAFHATLPESAVRYPLPETWHAEWGIRRFGFHGLSVAWAVEKAGELLGRPSRELALLVAHLGSGCSVTAVAEGRSVQTSMGFTPLEGLMMGTRAGSIDPGILLHLLRSRRIGLGDLQDALEHGSGLMGVSGLGSDVRALEAAANAGDHRARLALEMFIARAAAGIASAAVSLDRLDALVFTGGIGEHAGRIRAAIVDRLSIIGFPRIGPEETGVDRVLAEGDLAARADRLRSAVLRIEAREDLVIARSVVAVLAA